MFTPIFFLQVRNLYDLGIFKINAHHVSLIDVDANPQGVGDDEGQDNCGQQRLRSTLSDKIQSMCKHLKLHKLYL